MVHRWLREIAKEMMALRLTRGRERDDKFSETLGHWLLWGSRGVDFGKAGWRGGGEARDGER